MSVNNKDIIIILTLILRLCIITRISYECIYLGYNWLITQKTLLINAFFVNSKQWLQVMFTYQSFFLVLTIYCQVISTYCPRIDIYLSVLWLVISDISEYKNL